MIGARIHLVIIGILPNVNSTEQNWDANPGKSTGLRTGRLKVNPAKIPKKDNDRSAVALLKDSRQLGCVFQDIRAARIFIDFTEEHKCLGPTVIKLEEGEFAVDSGASMHMLSRKDPISAELETVRVSKIPTTDVKANDEVHTKEEATVYVNELYFFVTVKLLEDTLAVLSLGKTLRRSGYAYEWTSGQKPQLIKHGRRMQCSTENYVSIVVHGLSTGSSSSATPTSPESLPQDFVIPTLRPATTRSESMSSQVRGDPSSQPRETENTNRNGGQRDRDSTGRPVA